MHSRWGFRMPTLAIDGDLLTPAGHVYTAAELSAGIVDKPGERP